MFIFDDPENDDTATDNGDAEDNSDANDSATDDNSQQSDDDDASQDEDWEARYKGLQRATEKKRTNLEGKLTKAESDLESKTTELEGMKSDSGSLESKQKEAETAKGDLENEVQSLQEKHDQLENQLNQQNIVMSEFPQLAPVAKFIPNAESDEDFRTGAKEFNDAISTMIDTGVESSLKGSSATFKEGDSDDLDPGDKELDAAWETVYKYGGDPDHVEEYEAANAKIMAADPNKEL